MQEIIDVYGEEYLKNILSNYDKLSKVYEEATKSKIGMDGSDPEYQNIQKAIDLYITKSVASDQMKNDELLKNYRNVFNKTINNDITYIFTNELIKLPKERLKKVMAGNVYDSIQERKNKIESECHKIYFKYSSGISISQREEKILLDYLRATIGTRDKKIFEMQENMLRTILNDKKDNGYEEADFVVSFIANEEAKKLDITMLSHLSDFSGFKYKTARGLAKKTAIYIEKEYGINALNNKGNDLAKFIHTICHEAKHIEQNSNIINSVCNEKTKNVLYDKLFREYLSDEKFNFYKSNYYFESGEKDAEVAGFYNATVYVTKYLKNGEELKKVLLDEKDHQNYIQLIELRKDNEENKFDADYFRHKKIKEIVKEHPELVKQYRQLSYFFTSDGNLKSFQQQLIEYSDFKRNNKKDRQNIYYSTFCVAIDTNQLNSIDFSSMSREDIYKVMHSLSEFYNNQVESVHNTLEAKRLGYNFLDRENDIKNPETYLDRNIKKMSRRYQKLENILDIMYEKFGQEYEEIEEYKYDKFIYQKDKEYVRHKYRKISTIQKERYQQQLANMLEDTPDGVNKRNNQK